MVLVLPPPILDDNEDGEGERRMKGDSIRAPIPSFPEEDEDVAVVVVNIVVGMQPPPPPLLILFFFQILFHEDDSLANILFDSSYILPSPDISVEAGDKCRKWGVARRIFLAWEDGA